MGREFLRTASNYIKWQQELSKHLELACVLCGYDEYFSALDFHHKDPDTKVFGIGSYINQHSPTPDCVKVLLEEVRKCVLLCATCHRAFHQKLRSENIGEEALTIGEALLLQS